MNFKLSTTMIILFFSLIGCISSVKPKGSEVGSIVPTGQQEIRDLSPTTETIPNCSGGNTPVTKHPSMTVATSYAIEWEVGGEVGAGVTIGEGVVPGGANLEGALNGAISNGLDSGIEQSSAWDLSAEPNTIREYTIMWQEVWQPGYVNIILPTGKNIQVNVVYRSGIQSDIIGDKLLDCNGRQITATQPAQSIPIPDNQDTKETISFSNWQVPEGHNPYTEYRNCPQYPNDNFPDFSSASPGYILLNPQSAQLGDGVYTWCFQVRTVLDTVALEAEYSSQGYDDIESLAVYFCAAPAQGFCAGKELMPENSSVVVDDSCTLSPVLGNRNGVSTKFERTIRVMLPANATQTPTITVGPYPVGNPAYIACP
ncbi:MAG: hypothetical protein CSA11_01665 [Chloroflexi bacterium]|nr:MAG: hypothetical protein CSA11_01665 [Chloroflexota bacterium]